MSSMAKGIGVGVVAMLLLGLAAWLTIAYTGLYNVAASDMHADPVRWTFETTMHRSVASRAAGSDLPESFSDELVAEGAAHYAKTCAHCHGAPGQEPSTWSRGMRPEPPLLVEAAVEWQPEEIHWIVENGIKMTGMPAFGAHHDSEEILAITAFVTELPGLTPEDYQALTAANHEHGDAAPSAHSPRPADDAATE